MFNLYYLNYTKAFEIAMQIDNKLLEKQVKEIDKEKSLDGSVGAEVPESIFNKIFPKLSGNVSFVASRSTRTEDTLKVVSTKSTILMPVIQKAVEIKKIGSDRIGTLLKIKDVTLHVNNYKDMMGYKIMLSGLLNSVPVEGIGSMDLTSIANIVLKGASYIITGSIPKKVSITGEDETNTLLFKIPMQLENELENLYSIPDLEIGPVTVVGIYRGTFKTEDIKNRVDTIAKINEPNKQSEVINSEIETDNDVQSSIDNSSLKNKDMAHYIDVIAIIQELC